MDFVIVPVGHFRGGRAEAVDDDWGSSRATIEIDDARFTPEALLGLDFFSHAEVIFLFDKVPPEKVETGARHLRGPIDWPKIGIFARRGKNRPNRLGVSVCRIVGIDGTPLEIEGLDAIDETPVIDIKPVMQEFQPRGEIRQPAWVGELMAEYWETPR